MRKLRSSSSSQSSGRKSPPGERAQEVLALPAAQVPQARTVSAAAGDDVVAGSPDQRVAVTAAGDDVVAAAAIDDVDALLAEQVVVAAAALHDVVARAREDRLVSRRATQHVVTAAAGQPFHAGHQVLGPAGAAGRPPGQVHHDAVAPILIASRVEAVAGLEHVGGRRALGRIAGHVVAALPPEQPIRSEAAVEDVTSVATDEQVIARAALEASERLGSRLQDVGSLAAVDGGGGLREGQQAVVAISEVGFDLPGGTPDRLLTLGDAAGTRPEHRACIPYLDGALIPRDRHVVALAGIGSEPREVDPEAPSPVTPLLGGVDEHAGRPRLLTLAQH